MNFLIDTNVISELTRPRPDAEVVSFLHETDEDRLSMSVVTLAELRRCVALKDEGRAKRALESWLATISSSDSPDVSSTLTALSPIAGGN